MRKLSKTIPFVLVSLVSFTSVISTSAELPIRGPIPFANYDVDGDKFISEQEFIQVRNERKSAKAAQGRPMKGMRDAPLFSSFDENKDGQLTEQELIIGQQARMENRRNNQSAVANVGQGRSNNGKMRGKGNMPAFSDFDLNGDGIILEEELYEGRAIRITARVKQGYPMRNIANPPSFEEVDANDDRKVTPKEFAEFQVNHRAKMMEK